MSVDIDETVAQIKKISEGILNLRNRLERMARDYKYNGLNYHQAGELEAVSITLVDGIEILDSVVDRIERKFE